MKNIPIQDFMDEHRACRAGRRWVAEMGFTTCKETFEALCNGKAGEDSYNWAVCRATSVMTWGATVLGAPGAFSAVIMN